MEHEEHRRILLIDDEVGFTKLLKMNLERQGSYLVRILNDPLIALDNIAAYRPHLIILDMVMPGVDGGELSAKIRQHPEFGEVPIIFLTALVGKKDGSENSVSQHGDRVLVAKPVDLPVLLKVIESELY
ncbi:response regulator [Verrucomicrobiales bacterium]|jgi:CheY-like chemotaxis protein|nr:response regulator [Verrucomicrobiales bacterium]MDB4526923.1 response regulator [bacterium]MDC0503662.1 response regulator [Verrucomicrobiales bacterium]MDF1785926.1 response regulator [Verrucomicrobiales bacterium]